MSGRDSTPDSNTPTGGTGGVDCSQLRFNTFISSPKPAVLPQLNPGIVLNVDAYKLGATETVAVFWNGTLAGGIVDHSARLFQCITNGFMFKATVVSKNGAQVAIRIEPA